MIFTRTKRTAQRVADDLADRGFAAAAVHGDLGQGAREQALRAFRSGKVDVLVATDVAARGIDVNDVTHVDQLPVPRGREDLHPPDRPHRPGGQGGRRGHARRLGRHAPLEADQRRARARHRRAGRDLLHLRAPLTDLAIPTSATGRLPARQAHPRGPRGRVRRQRGRRRHGRKRGRTRSGGEHAEPATPVRTRRPRSRTRGGRGETQDVARPSRRTDRTDPPPGPKRSRTATSRGGAVAAAGPGAVARTSRSRTPARRTPPRAER